MWKQMDWLKSKHPPPPANKQNKNHQTLTAKKGKREHYKETLKISNSKKNT